MGPLTGWALTMRTKLVSDKPSLWPFDSGTPGTYHRKVQIIEESPGAGQTSPDSKLPGNLQSEPQPLTDLD